jgi:hypothetical protein
MAYQLFLIMLFLICYTKIDGAYNDPRADCYTRQRFTIETIFAMIGGDCENALVSHRFLQIWEVVLQILD